MRLTTALLAALLLLLLAAALLPAEARALSVQLSWDFTQDPAAPAVGFTVYRQAACTGAFAKVTATPLALSPLSFTDTSVSVGNLYCWVVKATDALGQESAPSNTVQFRLPSAPAAPSNLRGTLLP